MNREFDQDGTEWIDGHRVPHKKLRYEHTHSGDLYAESPDIKGVCSVCGDCSPHYQNKLYKGKYPRKPYYFKVFEEMTWFRGDDEYRGKICKQCLKEGKITLVRKGTGE